MASGKSKKGKESESDEKVEKNKSDARVQNFN